MEEKMKKAEYTIEPIGEKYRFTACEADKRDPMYQHINSSYRAKGVVDILVRMYGSDRNYTPEIQRNSEGQITMIDHGDRSFVFRNMNGANKIELEGFIVREAKRMERKARAMKRQKATV